MKYKKGDLIIERFEECDYLIVLTWVRGNKGHGYIIDDVTRAYGLKGKWIVEIGYEENSFEEPTHTNKDKEELGDDLRINLNNCQMVIHNYDKR